MAHQRDPRDGRLRSLTALFLLSAAACGDDGGGVRPEGVAVDDFCRQWQDALCAASARCGCAVDAATCEMRTAASCVLEVGSPTREMVDMSALPYDPAAAQRYLDAVRTSACDERPSLCGATGPCLGLSAEGGGCGETTGCAGELACVDGVCRARAANGATCTTGAGCTSGRCERGQCEAAAELGEACTEESACASGNCDFATGRCRDKEPDEALCTEHSECMSGYCDRDLALGAGNCQPLAGGGASCDEDSMCEGGACLGGACAPALCDDVLE
jgi:hypothetical protein